MYKLIVSALILLATLKVSAMENELPTFNKILEDSNIQVPSNRALDLVILDEAFTISLGGESTINTLLKERGYDTYKAFSLMNNYSAPLLRLIELIDSNKDQKDALVHVKKPYGQAIEKEVAAWRNSVDELKTLKEESLSLIRKHIKEQSPKISIEELDTQAKLMFFKELGLNKEKIKDKFNNAIGSGVVIEKVHALINGNNKPVEKLIKQVTSEVQRYALNQQLQKLQ